MKMIIMILTATIMSVSVSAQNTESILNKYLKVKDALVKSDGKAAADQVLLLQKEIEVAGPFIEKEGLLKAVQKMAKATNIEKQRTFFAKVSTIMWMAIKNNNDLKQDVYYQYCPMKKTYWLSKEAAIKNPYYGSSMLTCGNIAGKKLK